MTNEEKALLDLISYAEGTLGVSQNGYDIVYGTPYKKIIGWNENTKIIHDPKWVAVGRYQFQNPTWKEINKNKNLPLTKVNQDNSAVKLVNIKLGNIDKRKLTDKNNFISAINSLKETWVSFKVKTISDLFNVYNQALDLYKIKYP